jgi:DNA-binding XRE family transcriptional regulator
VPYRSSRPATIRRRAEVGDRIRSLRRRLKLSQEALGLTVGVDKRSIISIESGRAGITIDLAIDIADALHVPVTWLFSDDWTTPTDSDDPSGAVPTLYATPAPPDRQGST